MSRRAEKIPGGSTALERQAQRRKIGALSRQVIQDKTRNRYHQMFQRFRRFHRWAEDFSVPAPEEFDMQVSQFVEHLWETGAPKSDASYALAAIQFHRPQTKHHLTWSWKLVKTWNHIELPTRATPLTAAWTLALAGQAFKWQQYRMGWLLIVGFSLFLRTGEMVNLQKQDVSLPQSSKEEAVVYLTDTKTTKRNSLPLESVLVDDQLARKALTELTKGLLPGDTLGQMTNSQFRRLWADLLAALKINSCGFTPYSLRRGGATSAYRQGVQLDTLVTKGRWSHLSSCRIYLDQGAQALAEFSLPAASQPLLLAAQKHFKTVSQGGTRGMGAKRKR